MDARAYWRIIGCTEDCEFELPDGGCEAQTDDCSCTTWDLCVAAATKDREIKRLRARVEELENEGLRINIRNGNGELEGYIDEHGIKHDVKKEAKKRNTP